MTLQTHFQISLFQSKSQIQPPIRPDSQGALIPLRVKLPEGKDGKRDLLSSLKDRLGPEDVDKVARAFHMIKQRRTILKQVADCPNRAKFPIWPTSPGAWPTSSSRVPTIGILGRPRRPS